MADGWNCPNCGKAHGPHVDTCPETAGPPKGPVMPVMPSPAERWDDPEKWVPPWHPSRIAWCTSGGAAESARMEPLGDTFARAYFNATPGIYET